MARRVAGLAVVGALLTSAIAVAEDGPPPLGEVAAVADATRSAVRLEFAGDLAGDVVSVSQSRAMTAAVIGTTLAAAAAAGAAAVKGSGYSIGMAWVRRGELVVQEPNLGPGLWQIPMSVTILPAGSLSTLMGGEVASAVAGGMVAMSESAAGMRGARAGDTIGLVGAAGQIVVFTIGFVAPDSSVGGTEIVMSFEQAALLDATEVTRVLIYGRFSRAVLNGALSSRGLIDGGNVRVRRSWDAPNPDSTLGMTRTKQLFGEFAYQLTESDSIVIDPVWVATRLPPGREVYALGVTARCHNAIRRDLLAALDEVQASGLSGAIDLANTNTYGGCYNPRFNRLTGDLGFLSRHAWAQAIDMNTADNVQGRVPSMDCRVVRIFRKHNFAWGGNFLTPDGMHFEWVGEPRNALQYPSEYCPNVPTGGIESHLDTPTQGDTMFADDAWLTAPTE